MLYLPFTTSTEKRTWSLAASRETLATHVTRVSTGGPSLGITQFPLICLGYTIRNRSERFETLFKIPTIFTHSTGSCTGTGVAPELDVGVAGVLGVHIEQAARLHQHHMQDVAPVACVTRPLLVLGYRHSRQLPGPHTHSSAGRPVNLTTRYVVLRIII